MSTSTPSAANATGSSATAANRQAHVDAIDLRRMERYERLPLLELSFSVLQPGDVLEIVWETRPTRLERYLQTHYAERLAWWPVDSGDEWFTLGIRCLAPAAAES